MKMHEKKHKWIFMMLISLSVTVSYICIAKKGSKNERHYIASASELISTSETVAVEDKESQLENRRERVNALCEKRVHRSRRAIEISGIKSSNLSFCVVQKAGCTAWIRLFKFLEGQKIKSGNPMSISKYEVHYKEQHMYKRYSIQGKDDYFIMKSLRVMSVRDPYTRLWSGYIDKLLLPDFWQTKGKQIIKSTRENPTSSSIKCGYDVTFPEFVKYILATGHRLTYWNQDKHWLPASYICDPCLFKPAIISKQETLMSDLRYVLHQIGLEHLFDKMKVNDPIEFEIKDEIDYNFHIFKLHEKCITVKQLCERLWKAFILNGYIPASAEFPVSMTSAQFSASSFFNIIKKSRTESNMTKLDTKQNRKKALATAFSQIPQKDMDALKEFYKMDFEFFGYDI